MNNRLDVVWLTEPVNEHDHAQGPISADVTLVEYGDYTCPETAKAHEVVQALQAKLGDRIRFVFRNCLASEGDEQADLAAEAAEEAACQGLFWDMHAMLLKHQNQLDEHSLREYARTLELDLANFGHSVHGHRYHERIRHDIQSARASGVERTPTFFINGRRYDGPIEPKALESALQEAMT